MEMLIEKEKYLEYGVHIGTSVKTKDMKKFIHKILPNALAVFNLKYVDERIRVAAKLLSRYNKILVASRRFKKPVELFAEIIKAEAVTGRFLPGMFTNPHYEHFKEPEIVLITDPIIDKQALEEAAESNLPIVALCNTFNTTAFIDLIIPCNNRGRKSVALVFFLLAREVLKERGVIRDYKEFKYKIEDFIEPKKRKSE